MSKIKKQQRRTNYQNDKPLRKSLGSLLQIGSVLILLLSLGGCGGSSRPALFLTPANQSPEPVALASGSLDGVLLLESTAPALTSSDGVLLTPLVPSTQF